MLAAQEAKVDAACPTHGFICYVASIIVIINLI